MKSGLSPTGRALRALELLQAQPGITATQLAAQLGVTERAARRYVAILREADIPVESTRGPYGGYRAGRGIRLPPLYARRGRRPTVNGLRRDGRARGIRAPEAVRSGPSEPSRHVPPQLARESRRGR